MLGSNHFLLGPMGLSLIDLTQLYQEKQWKVPEGWVKKPLRGKIPRKAGVDSGLRTSLVLLVLWKLDRRWLLLVVMVIVVKGPEWLIGASEGAGSGGLIGRAALPPHVEVQGGRYYHSVHYHYYYYYYYYYY